ncbi:JDVT-CTERM domain-containing protein [Bathymodiolus thermophilus thioautotrophic gill symbiont]|uniref:JDVT-CTERM domain-containing protein n=1 Tax=Bathymodiolus thermophilus thioautotrophic gill symbiont TaxID=2360 RepID=UPI00192C441F|nr:JDVT-CTERM domain-containing protein [Bathymodiolus thermophilus thioautotrophic gill symbiont]
MVIFLNPALALLGQGLRKSPIGQKLNFANHPYLCKGLIMHQPLPALFNLGVYYMSTLNRFIVRILFVLFTSQVFSTSVNATEAATLATNKCSSCHGGDFTGSSAPTLIGKTSDYLRTRLNAFKGGQGNTTMQGIAANLSAAEINTLANYFPTLGALEISTGNVAVNENMQTVTTLVANKTGATFSLNGSGDDNSLFMIDGAVLKFKNVDGANFEASPTKHSFTVNIQVAKSSVEVKKTLTVTLRDLNDETPTNINFIGSSTIAENTAIGSELGTLSTIDADANDTFTYTSNNAILTIDGNTLKLNAALNYESATSFTATITVTDGNAHSFNKTFDFLVSNIEEDAITLTRKEIAFNATAGAIIGTLSKVDASTLTYSVNDTTNFEITDNQLKIKIDATAITFPATITITASDGALTPTKDFTITKTIDNADTPVINQFIVTQGGNNGRLIGKTGGTVTVNALVSAETYDWSKSDITGTSNQTIFSFDPVNTNTGILKITLKAQNNNLSSERVLKLKLIAGNVNSENNDKDSDGIPDNKDTHIASNKIQAGEGKTMTSLGDTRILLGAMGKDSGRLTLDRIKQHITDNHLTENAIDTLTTGNIYDYVVEGLSAIGTSTQVIIELTTAIPKDAVLRKYSLVNGWSNFMVDDNNTIKSSADNTCANNATWQTGLITGATCLKLTVKDGGANDTDGDQTNNTGQANGVVESTISIATPAVISDDDNSSSDSSSGGGGGGCVYNPNAPARFDMGFILLMTLSAYYLMRRRRRFVR